MVKLTPLAAKYFTHLKTFSGKYIDTLPYIVIGIVIGIVISYISVRVIIQWLKTNKEIYTDVTTTTDPVISYEKTIPTNIPGPTPKHTKLTGMYAFVEPNKRPPGHYNESKVDLLVTNGLFTIGSNWLYDLIFVAA